MAALDRVRHIVQIAISRKKLLDYDYDGALLILKVPGTWCHRCIP